MKDFCVRVLALFPMLMASAQMVYPQTNPTNPYKAPLYWSVYEYHIMRERTGLPGNQNYFPESEFAAHVDMVESKLKPFGYNMVCMDGWGDTSKINANGYRLTHSRNWTHDFGWWSTNLISRGMKLGMYANPLWLHVDSNNTNATIVGTNLKVSSLFAADDPWWVQIDRPGAEAYVKGYIQYFADMGIDYLRVDFLSWYESGTDRYLTGTVPNTRAGGHGSANYATTLRWMREAADQHGIFLSLVMPHLYNEAASEQLYGHMIRINEDTFGGGWWRWNSEARGIKRVGWSVFANPMDGLTYWSYIAGRGKMILDPDFIRLNTFGGNKGFNISADEEKKTVISSCLLAGGPVTASDTLPTLGRNLWLYTNPEMLALNYDGFVGKPLTNDVNSPNSQIWTGQMSNGDWILGLFNREDVPQTRSFNFSQIGLASARVRDLWQHADLGTTSSLSLSIPAHGCRIFRLVPGAGSLPGSGALRLTSLTTDTVAGGSGGLRARASLTVTDGANLPVSGVTITASFLGSYQETVTGTTDASGQVRLITTAALLEFPKIEVQVLEVQKPGYIYAADLNLAGTDQRGDQMFLGGNFTDWRLQDIPMSWVDGAWQANGVALGTHLYPGTANNYQMKFADAVHFAGNDWGGAAGTNGTAQLTSGGGGNLTFSLSTNGLYQFRFNPANLAYQISQEWASTDVGAVGIAGFTTSPAPASYVLHASGADIETNNDEFHFLWQSRAGDLDLQAKVTRLANTDPWAKAGLMIRTTNNTGSRHVSIFVTPDNTNASSSDNGVILQRRNSINGTTTKINQTGISTPAWLRLKKTGTTFNAYYSTHGQGWTLLGTTNVNSIGSPFLVGLAACGHSDGTLTEALFEEVYLRTNTSTWFWTPGSPVRGQTATLTYFAEGRPLLNSPDVLVRIRPNNGTEEITPTPAMTEISPDIWTLSYAVPSGATNLAFSFANAAGLTDTGGTVTTAAATSTPPGAPPVISGQPTGQNPYPYVTGSSVRFTWNPATSADGLAALYRVTINKNGASTSTLTGLTEISVPGGVGDQISVSVQPVHALDFSQAAAASTSSLSNTFLSPATDQDADGMTNSAEEIAGTNPFNASSVFQVSQISPSAGSMTLTWPSVPGKTYRVQWSDNLGTSTFGSSAQSPLLTASPGSTTSWTDVNAAGSRRFYKVVVVP